MKQYIERDKSVLKATRFIFSAQQFTANARELFFASHYRSSVVEAYCAVESAVYHLGTQNQKSAFADKFDHIVTKTLKKDIEYIGISRSLRYLVPLLYPEVQQNNLLNDIIELEGKRGSVVHSGTTDHTLGLDRGKILLLIDAAEMFCKFIDDKTRECGKTGLMTNEQSNPQ